MRRLCTICLKPEREKSGIDQFQECGFRKPEKRAIIELRCVGSLDFGSLTRMGFQEQCANPGGAGEGLTQTYGLHIIGHELS